MRNKYLHSLKVSSQIIFIINCQGENSNFIAEKSGKTLRTQEIRVNIMSDTTSWCPSHEMQWEPSITAMILQPKRKSLQPIMRKHQTNQFRNTWENHRPVTSKESRSWRSKDLFQFDGESNGTTKCKACSRTGSFYYKKTFWDS